MMWLFQPYAKSDSCLSPKTNVGHAYNQEMSDAVRWHCLSLELIVCAVLLLKDPVVSEFPLSLPAGFQKPSCLPLSLRPSQIDRAFMCMEMNGAALCMQTLSL